MNKSEFINALKENTDSTLSVLPKTKIKEILEGILQVISDSVATHRHVELGELGVLEYDFKKVKDRLEPIVRLRSNNTIKEMLNDEYEHENIEVCEDTKKVFFDSRQITDILIASFGKDVKQKDTTFIKNGLIKLGNYPSIPLKFVCPIDDLNTFIALGYKIKKKRKIAVKKDYTSVAIPVYVREIDGVEYEFFDSDNYLGLIQLGEIII